jgi:hypothetical protein
MDFYPAGEHTSELLGQSLGRLGHLSRDFQVGLLSSTLGLHLPLAASPWCYRMLSSREERDTGV